MVLGLIKIDGRTRGANIFHFTSWTFHTVTNGFECDRRPATTRLCQMCTILCWCRYGMHPFVIYFRFFRCLVFEFSLAIWYVRKVWRYVCTRTDRYCVMHSKTWSDLQWTHSRVWEFLNTNLDQYNDTKSMKSRIELQHNQQSRLSEHTKSRLDKFKYIYEKTNASIVLSSSFV